ncbi:DNA polymerase IV [bacterium]|nr:DNA polymerase IV [bacterium]
MNKPLYISSWPSCILHLDADNFFAAVEQTVNPRLKGKPVITGAERGIVAAASIEAKARGVKRGVSLADAKKMCPGLVCVPSDYETYSLFSKRMFAIMRRFTPMVEEYSIDEAFADLSGLRQVHRASYGEIAKRIKESVENELGLTVSVGLSLTKSIAKLASKFKKPSGLTLVPGIVLDEFLKKITVEKVWGFGPNKTALLNKLHIKTAYDFIKKPEGWVKDYLHKPGVEIHRELLGHVVWPVSAEEKSTYASISKTKTFTPPSNKKDFVYAQALRNLEGACLKARRFGLEAKTLSLYLKTQNFKGYALDLKLPYATSVPLNISAPFYDLFEALYRPNTLYRATGVVLGELSVVTEKQFSLFENPVQTVKQEWVTKSMDSINAKYGKFKVHLAESLSAQKRHEGARGELPARKKELLKGENFRQRLGIVLLKHSI